MSEGGARRPASVHPGERRHASRHRSVSQCRRTVADLFDTPGRLDAVRFAGARGGPRPPAPRGLPPDDRGHRPRLDTASSASPHHRSRTPRHDGVAQHPRQDALRHSSRPVCRRWRAAGAQLTYYAGSWSRPRSWRSSARAGTEKPDVMRPAGGPAAWR